MTDEWTDRRTSRLLYATLRGHKKIKAFHCVWCNLKLPTNMDVLNGSQTPHSLTLQYPLCYLGLLLGHGPDLMLYFHQWNVFSNMFSFLKCSTSAFFGGLPLIIDFLTMMSKTLFSSSVHFFFADTIKKKQ